MRAIFAALILARVLASSQSSGSWLSCPPSFNPAVEREVELEGPCEREALFETVKGTRVHGGDRLKVAWPSNNQGGGLVRLALVPASERNSHEAFDKAVIKVSCFGHDERPGNFYYGYCNHPCDAHGPEQFQHSLEDTNRYGTTITVPLNLAEGPYVLQWKGLLSGDDGSAPSYSCSLLHIVSKAGGLDHAAGKKECSATSSAVIRMPSCYGVEEGKSPLLEGTEGGRFCYTADGSNDVDANIAAIPINASCDGRLDCTLAVSEEDCLLEMTKPSLDFPPFFGGSLVRFPTFEDPDEARKEI